MRSSKYLPPETQLAIIIEVAFYQLIAQDYSTYVDRIAQLARKDRTLKDAGRHAVMLAERYKVLRKARPDECFVLRRWRTARWSRSFDVRSAMGVPKNILDEDGVDRSAIAREASKAIMAAGRRLEQLGASTVEARDFVNFTDLFSSRAILGPSKKS